ncbi:cupin domain-containing protein [Pseudaminobacter sp. 19-2017]|uniref:Cupin domain-containing protein n=2 Tax=Pseudaminobacter soli (ex Zhang et al. 2022) TaxID=2831468 RepID=A0A942I9T2_9HYPH|nr:cupin domain-containing protein [Pseudaminobacter soli]
MTRRSALGAAAAGAGGVLAAAAAGEPAQAQAPAPAKTPLTQADELPTFRFPLGEQKPVTHDGGYFREASVLEFPASENIAGVLVNLAPGGIRELHWHANAAEWAYVIGGHCRVTASDPAGHCEVLDFAAGDVWYFPRGHGHCIQAYGDGECQFIEVFDNGHFSGFSTFSSTDWFAHTPPEILAKNFGVPASIFENFPKQEVFIGKGTEPGPLPVDPPFGSQASGPLTHRYRLEAQQPQTFAGGAINLASATEFPLSANMTGAVMRLKPGALREMHWHPNADEWQYYLKGRARMSVFGAKGRNRTFDYGPGDVGYVPLGYGHYIENVGEEDVVLVLVLNSGTYQEISATAWLAGNPPELLAANFGVPASVFAQFPKKSAFITAG